MKLHLLLLLLSYEHVQVDSADTSKPILSSPSTSTLTVQPKENITLTCNITDKYKVAWYRLSSTSKELTLLILAEKTRTLKRLPVYYNTEKSRFVSKADREITEASLTLVEVDKDDLGLYFCGTADDRSQIHFARPIRIQFEDIEDRLASQKPSKEEGEDTDEVSLAERALMLGGVAVVGLVFLVATVAAGTVIHQRAWRSGWAAAQRGSSRLYSETK